MSLKIMKIEKESKRYEAQRNNSIRTMKIIIPAIIHSATDEPLDSTYFSSSSARSLSCSTVYNRTSTDWGPLHQPPCVKLIRFLQATERDSLVTGYEDDEDLDSELPSYTEEEKRQSWNQIFELDFSCPLEEAVIQATFWELKLEQVKEVKEFGKNKML